MHIAPVWPSTVKTSNRANHVYRSGSDARVQGGDVWRVVREKLRSVPKEDGPLRLTTSLVTLPWATSKPTDIEAYFDRRAKIITRGDRCGPGRAPGPDHISTSPNATVKRFQFACC
jgi:hypothetical protein